MHGGDKAGASQVYPYGGRFDGKFDYHYLNDWQNKYVAEFQRASAGLRESPLTLGTYEWLALGRHFGLVTRLLDWTEKPYVAAFFALHDMIARTPSATRWSESIAVYRFQYEEDMLNHNLRLVRPVVDELARMHRQRSIFTFLESTRYFEIQGLCSDTGTEANLRRAVLSGRALRDGLSDLAEHGIDHGVLFPDLGGAAQRANLAVDLMEAL
jgi:hypothetical protein